MYTVLGRGLRRSAIETCLGHVLSPFVGRSSEVQTLHELLAYAKAMEQLAQRFPKSQALAPTRLRLAEAATSAHEYDRAAELFRLVAAQGDPALKVRAQSGLGWALLEGGHAAAPGRLRPRS